MHFETAKLRFESELRRAIEQMGKKTPLRDACEYALAGGGKRLRPLIVLMTADALGPLDAMPAAVGVEFFHTASLIADDLPCMDNDSLRRGRPSLHKAFGESAAILASYTLIAAGYGGIHQNSERMKSYPQFAASAERRAVQCLEAATRCAGICGATQGQFLDLYPPDSSLETIREIICKKTVTLFEVSFLFGWLFGGGDLSALPNLQDCARHLGMAFQIADDLEDAAQDAPQEGGANIAQAMGKEKAISLFEEEIASLHRELKNLNLWTAPFQELYKLLNARRGFFAPQGPSRRLLGKAAH